MPRPSKLPRACAAGPPCSEAGRTPTTRSPVACDEAPGGESEAGAEPCRGRARSVLGAVAALCAAGVGIVLLINNAWSVTELEAASAARAPTEHRGFLSPDTARASPAHARVAGAAEQRFVSAPQLVPAVSVSLKAGRPALPSPMLAGYTGGATTEKILAAVRAGVNTIYWCFLDLSNNGVIVRLNTSQVLEVHRALAEENRSVAHMVSIGGWNGHHNFSTGCSPEPCDGARFAASFEAFNAQTIADGEGWPGFTGIDWDIEGHDDWNSSRNEFTLEELAIMLEMSRALRPKFAVSMVPSQSYFNCRESGFDLSLRHAALSNPDFKYAGRNVYAALYAKAPEVFDMVIVQLYEGYSDAGFDLYWGGSEENVGADGWPRQGSARDMTRIVRESIECITNGSWAVDFDGFWGLPNRTVIRVPLDQAAIGLANGWAPAYNFKFPYFQGVAAARAIRAAGAGAAYWSIAEEDAASSMTSALRGAAPAWAP